MQKLSSFGVPFEIDQICSGLQCLSAYRGTLLLATGKFTTVGGMPQCKKYRKSTGF